MEREYPVPGYSKYFVTEAGEIVSYYHNKRKILKAKAHYKHSLTREHRYVNLYADDGSASRRAVHRVVIAAKCGRWLESWEHCRHINGNSNDNRMCNLEPGCVLMNTIDDIENGTRETSAEYVAEAIKRLHALQLKLS